MAFYLWRLCSSCINNTDLAPAVVRASCQQTEHCFLKYSQVPCSSCCYNIMTKGETAICLVQMHTMLSYFYLIVTIGGAWLSIVQIEIMVQLLLQHLLTRSSMIFYVSK